MIIIAIYVIMLRTYIVISQAQVGYHCYYKTKGDVNNNDILWVHACNITDLSPTAVDHKQIITIMTILKTCSCTCLIKTCL